ncbi:unnamed protein product [Gadus morhua 'NCC']
MNGAGVCVCPEPVAGLVVVDGAIIARAAADTGGSSCCGSVRRDGVSPRHPGEPPSNGGPRKELRHHGPPGLGSIISC